MKKRSKTTIGLGLLAMACATASWAQSTHPTEQLTPLAMATTTSGMGISALPQTFNWMSPEVSQAWNQGYFGQGTNMTIVDDFSSSKGLQGNLGLGKYVMRHGEWTRAEAALLAPLAELSSHDFYSGKAITLTANRLNVLNVSYAAFHSKAYASENVYWSPQEMSLVAYAKNGQAVVSKAAGNDGIAVGTPNSNLSVDGLNVLLKGAPSAILVGALNRNGTTSKKADIAWYSNKPGKDAVYQNMFLTVGVDHSKTGLAGTSFAAPIISGYAAILGSKFTKATPTAIVAQLLTTARKDTVRLYDPSIFGRGEASLSRALAPATIN